LRQSNGTFVTTGTWLNVSNVGITSTRIEESIMSGLAAEEIPKFSLVQLRKGRRLVLARSTDYTSRVSGIVSTDLYQGEVDVVISTGVVRNEEWSFKDSQIDRPVFCGPTGEVTLTPPHTGVLQQVGFVYDTNAIFMGLKQVIVLDPPGYILPPPNPTLIPAANFSASVVSGSAPLQVQFTNSSTGGLSYEWDFTNDGFVDTTEENPTYTFSAPGIYTVRLRAINGELYNDKVQANVIVVTDPTSVPGNVNLGISFGAPARVDAGTAFSFQVFSVNNGSIKATHVQRVIKLRSSDGSAVTLVNSPPGSLLDIQGPITQITLPEISILPGAPPSTAVLKVLSAATARAIQLDGTVVSSETDSTPQDNSASTTVMVHA
jgi:PKD repeat protein